MRQNLKPLLRYQGVDFTVFAGKWSYRLGGAAGSLYHVPPWRSGCSQAKHCLLKLETRLTEGGDLWE